MAKSNNVPVVRYAVVGLGHIAQVAVLPAFARARTNSRLTAIVSGDPAKRKRLARKYHVTSTYSYEEYDECLRQVDAVYIALPNSMHADYTVRAANAGVHVLCEKPMAVTVEDCQRMIDACAGAQVKLMIAYRLHLEPINLEAIELVRRGRIGEPKFFNSSFSLSVRARNVRLRREMGGGTLYDIGVYCINAARHLFRAEPNEVMAISVNSGLDRLSQVDESTGALMRFDGQRVAAFVTSFNSADVSSYRIVGSSGQLHAEPGYDYSKGLSYELTSNGKTTRKRIGRRDQFAPQLLYFSDCILNDRGPEPSGEEGLRDVRIVRALYESAETGKAVQIPPFEPAQRPREQQRLERAAVQKRAPVRGKRRSA